MSRVPARRSEAAPHLGDLVYRALRDRLIAGDLEPGDTLSIRRLAAEHAVSAMPVREALKRLEAAQALTGAPKRAYRVPEMAPARAAGLFRIRAVLEGAAAEAAATRLTPRRIARLRDLTRTMDRAMAAGDGHGYLAANFAFHSEVCAGAGNPDLDTMVEALHTRTGPWLARAIRRLASRADWANQHHEIADALAARDPAEARRLMEADILWNDGVYTRAMG